MTDSSKPPVASRVRVVLRVRPFLPSELRATDERNCTPCVTLLDQGPDAGDEVGVLIKDQWTSRCECYKLDSLFGQFDRVGAIFHREVSAVIPGVFKGLNATIFAYGATGSGKTYTMQGTEDEPGLIPLAMSTVLSMCQGAGRSVEISYYEVYMDRCYDLLEPKAKEIMALDDKDGRLQLKGLSSVGVRSMDEFCYVYATGVQRRKVAHTGLNDVSSRSHAVLSIVVTNDNVKGKLNLIDLAGNEDNRRTCNQGIRLQESAKINQSLFALSNVIYALNNNEPRIPYRESKLTRILQDSLGGTSRSLIIACLNPVSYQEAVHTVSLAARSRQVVNHVGSASKKETPRVKVDMEAKLLAWLESKGKSKSIQRTPTSLSYSKKPGSICRSPKGVSAAKGRKLFDSMSLSSPTREVGRVENFDKQDDHKSIDSLCISAENTFDSQSRAEMSNHPVTLEIPTTAIKLSNTAITSEATFAKPSFFYGSPFNKENEQCNPKSITLGSPVTKERSAELQSSRRRVLSPLSPNIEQIKYISNFSSEDPGCLTFLDGKTPSKSSHVDEFQMNNTPLGKFYALSSNLKESLVQEYLEFLNIANKEELMQLKGIGQKRAEYILDLREQSPRPFKSLADLKEIGLSLRQVQDMFRRAATGIFA